MADAQQTAQPKPAAPPQGAQAVQQADATVRAAEIKALEAEVKVDEAKMTPEQRDAEKARAEADDARAAAEKARADAAKPQGVSTVTDAKVAAPVDPDMPASHHMAQKFGNDPANPKPATAEHADEDKQTVRLTRITPDSPEPVTADVHPEMVGDYLRAGWSR